MKVAIVAVTLSLAVMIAIIFQAVNQELKLRNLKTRMVENSAEVKRKEDAIIDVKRKIKEVKTALESANAKIDELKKKKADTEKAAQEHDKSLQTCNTEKGDVERKRSEFSESVDKLKADHEADKNKAEADIKGLKQQILDRDKAICAFVDTTKEEARKLCGITEAQK